MVLVLKERLEEALQSLWYAAFLGEKLQGLISEQWKELGWQGKDPSTDFRGGGFISPENLLYFAKNYPNAHPPLASNCSAVLASLIKHCWLAKPSKWLDFTYMVSILEKYDQNIKVSLLRLPHPALTCTNLLLERFKSCASMTSSISVDT